MKDPVEADIDAILSERFPWLLKLLPLAKGILRAPEAREYAGDLASDVEQLESERARLRSLPASQLRSLADQCRARAKAKNEAAAAEAKRRAIAEREARERLRFYNQPAAKADFGLWLRVEYWTASEAAALMMDRDPRCVNPESLAHELAEPTADSSHRPRPPQSRFHLRFEELRLLVSRSASFKSAQIRPAELANWAYAAGLALPPELSALVKPNGPGEVTAEDESKLWTDPRLAELAAYRAQHTAKETAEHYGVSTTRIRELLAKWRSKEAGSPLANVARQLTRKAR